MWNCKDLPAPPYCEMKSSLTGSQKACVLEARKHLKESEAGVRDHIKLLSTELYVTKRMIYKLRNQFRSDKSLQTLRQVHACLKRLEVLNLEKQLSDTLQIVDRVFGGDDTEVYLASRQVLEYHLVVLQGTSALLRQVVQYSLKTFIHVRQHLELGNMIPNNLILLALSSRIWYVCNSLGLHVCKWYKKLYPCLNVLPPTTVTWLQGEELPSDLTDWLTELFDGIGLPGNFCSELQKSVDVEKMNGALPSSMEFLEAVADQEDIGEPIQRNQHSEESAEIKPSFTQIHFSSKRKLEINKDKSEETKKQKVKGHGQSTDVTEAQGIQKLKSKTYRQLQAAPTAAENEQDDVIVTEVNTKDVGSIRAHLDTVLHTCKDVDNIIKQVKSGTVEICGNYLKLSKTGRKKIMLHIDRWKRLIQEKGSLSDTEKLFVKKVKGPLSELLVKHSQTFKGPESENKTSGTPTHMVKSTTDLLNLPDLKDVEVDASINKVIDLYKVGTCSESVVKKKRKKKQRKDSERNKV